jgi:beta-mannan synthase
MNVKYEIRDNRSGYKAGALKEGMTKDYVQDCEYVAIFDADFQPESDFLLQTIPFLIYNPQIALVQARWRFGIYLSSLLLLLFVLISYYYCII